jgi:hypothetical protein
MEFHPGQKSMSSAWIECGEKVHGLYSELLSVGSSLMRVEDHLTLGIPGADVELEEIKEKLTGMVKNIEELLVLLRGNENSGLVEALGHEAK